MPRLSSSDAHVRASARLARYNLELLAYSRAAVARSLALLRQTVPSTYLGKRLVRDTAIERERTDKRRPADDANGGGPFQG